jgi:ABC-type uncharacterized transport system permease subunit
MILSFGSGGTPHVLALVVAGTAVLAYAMSALSDAGNRPLPTRAWQIGWLAQALVLLIDFADLDAPPGHRAARFGFAPVLSTTVWLVLTVHAIESRFVPLPQVRRVLAVLGAVSVALAAFFPGEPHPAAATPWAPLHWMLGVASYGLFGAAVLHASMLDSADRQLKLKAGNGLGPGGLPLLKLERLTFRFVDAGFVVLSATLLLGIGSTTQWRWDHKTIFSLLGWAVFAGLIAGRHLQGWRGRRATRWLYAGAALLLLAYVGSRFVLEVLLHRAA